ncbi:hypothetical protein HAX54_023064, partial [Datura stramonium]|nr:hypothetical protein [Datura stramonium]
QILASGHYLDPTSNRRFADHNRLFTDKSSVEMFPSQSSSYHQWFINKWRITSCSSPTFY